MNNGHLVSNERVGINKRRILIVLPATWETQQAIRLKERLEDGGHHVTVMRADDMMGVDDIVSAMPNKDVAFMFIPQSPKLSRARAAAQRHNVMFHVATVGTDSAASHVLANI